MPPMSNSSHTVITPAMRSHVGVESRPVAYNIEKGAVAKFARAIGDSNPLYTDEVAARSSRFGGLIAPPTFLRSLVPGQYAPVFPNPYSFVLDAGSDYRFLATVRVGDRVAVTRRIVDMFEKHGKLGPMLFLVQETRYENQLGELVATQRTTTISYGIGPRDPAIDDI